MTTSTEPQFTMYTTGWCGYCARLKKQLAEHEIFYTEIDIESDEKAAEYVRSVNNGNQTVPTVRFHDDTAVTNPPLSVIKKKLSDAPSE